MLGSSLGEQSINTSSSGTFTAEYTPVEEVNERNRRHIAHRDADVVQLSKYVVTAAGYEQAMANAPASISVVSQMDLETKPFITLTDAVKDMPGVTLTKSKAGDDISLRGMGSDYTLILVDGRRQNSREIRPNGFGEAETGFIPPIGAIERIELVRGPMSTLYGSDAMGGVVNIITRKVAPRWGGSIGADYTFQFDSRLGDPWSGNIYINGPLVPGKLGLALFGRYYHRDEDELGVPGNSPGRVGAREADLSNLGVRLSYTPTADHDIILEAGASRQRYEGTPGKTGTMGSTTTSDSPYDPVQRYNRDYVTLSHAGRWSIGNSDISLQYEDGETLGRNVTYVKAGGGKHTTPRTLEIQNLVADGKLHLPLPKNNLTVGGQFIDSNGKDGVAFDDRNPNPDGTYPLRDLGMTQYSLFAEDEFRILRPLALTGGVRYDHHDSFGDQFSPRGYIVWNTTRALTLKGGVSTGFKTPRLTQTVAGLSGIGGQGTVPILGNPDLKPETSTSYEVGVTYIVNGSINATLTGFYNQFDDKIASRTIARGSAEYDKYLDPNAWSRDASAAINIDTAETRGFEAGLNYRFLKAWKAIANYTYIESEQTSGANEGKPLNNMPKHHVNGTLSYDITRSLNVWVRGSWYGKEWRDNLPDYKSYALFDLGTSWKATRHLTLNAGIYNIFDKDLHDTTSYSTIEDGCRLWTSVTLSF